MRLERGPDEGRSERWKRGQRSRPCQALGVTGQTLVLNLNEMGPWRVLSRGLTAGSLWWLTWEQSERDKGGCTGSTQKLPQHSGEMTVGGGDEVAGPRGTLEAEVREGWSSRRGRREAEQRLHGGEDQDFGLRHARLRPL